MAKKKKPQEVIAVQEQTEAKQVPYFVIGNEDPCIDGICRFYKRISGEELARTDDGITLYADDKFAVLAIGSYFIRSISNATSEKIKQLKSVKEMFENFNKN